MSDISVWPGGETSNPETRISVIQLRIMLKYIKMSNQIYAAGASCMVTIFAVAVGNLNNCKKIKLLQFFLLLLFFHLVLYV